MKRAASLQDHNRTLASIFREMAACYRYLGPEERFRAIAYERAARTMESLQEDVEAHAQDVDSLDRLSGIGESIAEKILEYLSSGRIATHEELRRLVPTGLLDLMDVNGVGPSTLRILHEKLGVDDRDGLLEAIQAGRLDGLKGFGEKKVSNIRRALKIQKETADRMLLWDALGVAEALLAKVRALKGVRRAEIAGSLRRMKETIGDIDLVIVAAPSDRKSVIRSFLRLPEISRVVAAGDTKASVMLMEPSVQADVRIVSGQEFGSAMLYFTGSKEHNIRLRKMAKDRGWKINEYGLFDNESGRRLAGQTEQGIYEVLGLSYVEPEMREDRGEIEMAQKGRLPSLVTLEDVRGDLQMHSKWSDGTADVSDMADYILAHHPGYDYIVMTDHSPSSRIAGGLSPDEFRRQFKEINEVNRRIGKPLVKKGVEVDILADGRLDLPDKLLSEFEWVTASIHSGFSKDNTDRLVQACEHPLVHCIGHPSGRLIGRRDAYPVDWQRLFKAAAATGTAIEINAQPERLDLRDEHIAMAVGLGVRFTVSTDAHDPASFALMRIGVATARRGGCRSGDILNTLPWKELAGYKATHPLG
jgi:DNA polymerase (family 10)